MDRENGNSISTERLRVTLDLVEEIILQQRIHIAKLEARNEDWYTDMFHPEFGSEWADDGECTKAYMKGYIAAMQQKEVVKKRIPIEIHEIYKNEVPCSDHPFAPHGFDRNASHNAGRYVCECENWNTDER